MEKPHIATTLTGVPETLLWTLHCRAEESERSDAVLVDEMAVTVRDAIDYDFAGRFGRPDPVFALRAACFDAAVVEFLAEHPSGTVVALGDGLETQFWRLDNGSATWVSVDLADAVELRRRALPDGERNRSVACSALDPAWMDQVDPSDGLFITAQGLFMYLDGAEVIDLIGACASRFPGAHLLFDAVPGWLTSGTGGETWLSRMMMRGREGDDRYHLPPMTWGAGVDTIRRTLEAIDVVAATHIRRYPPGRGFGLRTVFPRVVTMPVLRNICPSVLLVDFTR